MNDDAESVECRVASRAVRLAAGRGETSPPQGGQGRVGFHRVDGPAIDSAAFHGTAISAAVYSAAVRAAVRAAVSAAVILGSTPAPQDEAAAGSQGEEARREEPVDEAAADEACSGEACPGQARAGQARPHEARPRQAHGEAPGQASGAKGHIASREAGRIQAVDDADAREAAGQGRSQEALVSGRRWDRSAAASGQFGVEPRTGDGPISFHGPGGNLQDQGRLFFREAAKVA